MKVISWNLLRLVGASVEEVAELVKRHKPDLLFMQEVTKAIDTLPALAGGHFHRQPWTGRIHGLAAWSPHPLAAPHALPLPASRLPGRLPRRAALIVTIGEMMFANVHLSHGQLLNRRQLRRIAEAFDRHAAAIIGDFNAVGPIILPGFKDVGPREATHRARNVVPFRLDRCLVRGLRNSHSSTLDYGLSDHRPIVVDLHVEAISPALPLKVGQ